MAKKSRRSSVPRIWLLAPIIAIGSWVIFCGFAAIFYETSGDTNLSAVFVITASMLGFGSWIAYRMRGNWWPALQSRLEAHTAAIDALLVSRQWLWIALAAAVGLYLELVLIRFHGSAFQLFAFFKNVSLLSCFLGLGIGYGLGRTRLLFTPLVLPLLTAQLVFMHLLRFTSVGHSLQNPVSEEFAMGMPTMHEFSRILMAYCAVLWVFSFNAICLIPLGQLASRLMNRAPKLPAYSWNLVGSLAGVLAFYGVSFLWMPPVVWFAIAILILAVFLRTSMISTVAAGSILLGTLAVSLNVDSYDLYSPYQILTVMPHSDGSPMLLVNHAYFQRILDLGPQKPINDVTRLAGAYYDLPYLFQPHPHNELIVGSGTGNDVAAALRHGADHIDAVEIDPTILQLGKIMHPEQPYASEHVTPHVQDARAFIRYSRDQYDMIVYGLLDSHTLLSGMAGVRLDSYIYTVEALREARARLSPDGIICLSFSIQPEMSHKAFMMLKEAFDGQDPLVYQSYYDAALTFVAGANLAHRATLAPPDLPNQTSVGNPGPGDPSTDDWPFFYMPVRKYPLSYLTMIAILLVTAVIFIAPVLRHGGGKVSAPCFLLGAGFMLLETKAITELALFYGSTWVVIGVVIIAILLMAFLANLLVMKLPKIPRIVSYLLLLASLGLSLWFSTVSHNIQNEMTGRLLATAIVTLPLFFSGLVFSSEMNSASSIAAAFGSNLIGAMLGGCLEYNSMYFGYRSLYILALIIYALSAVVSLMRPSKQSQTPSAMQAAAL